MLSRLLPPLANFTYTGSRVSLWLLGIVLFVKVAIALGAIFNGHYAASVADGIPIDSFTPQGTQAFLSVFASLGLSQLILGVLGVVLLLKYRPLVPMFLLVLLIVVPGAQGGQCLHAHSTLWRRAWRSNQLGHLRGYAAGVRFVHAPAQCAAIASRGLIRRSVTSRKSMSSRRRRHRRSLVVKATELALPCPRLCLIESRGWRWRAPPRRRAIAGSFIKWERKK
jgi:hypothetical protein